MPASARTVLTHKARAAADAPPSRSGRAWADLLAEVPLFTGVPARQVRKIAGLGSTVRLDANEVIVRAGDPGEAFYVILSGRAEVRKRARGRPTAELGPGAYFGEMALLDGAPRSATVVAKSETVCLILARKPFDRIVKKEPAIAAALLRTLAARVRKLEANLAG